MNRYLLDTLFCFIITSAPLFSLDFLKTEGRLIVDENNKKVILKGFGLGGWLVLEGYMWNYPGFGSTTTMENSVEFLVGKEKKEEFFRLYRQNYISEKDIAFLAESGFNAIRVPLHHKFFSPNFREFTTDGFDLLGPIVSACRENNIYLILDMHAAPGGQNTSDFSDSDGQTAKLFTEFENQRWLCSTWKYIANHYKNESVIAAYDLLNEPVLPWGVSTNEFKNLYQLMIDSIRTVDPNHIVIIEGNWYGNDHTGLLPPFDDKMVYSFHHYVGASESDTTTMYNQYRTGISVEHNVPLWVGEFGENSNYWGNNIKDFFERNDIGWSWWNYKSLERISSLFSYDKTEGYQTVLDYWGGTITKPDTLTAFNGLMSMARSVNFDSCKINYGLIRALIDSNYNSKNKPYFHFEPPGLLPVANYDTGNNLVSYFDIQIEDPRKFSPDTESWNNGWTYRNDGVDIGSITINNRKEYFVGWIDNGEWMKYTITPKDPGNYKLMVEAGSYSGSGKFYVELGSEEIFGPITVPNTNGWNNGWVILNIGNTTISDTTEIKIVAEVGGFTLKNLIFQELDISNIPMKLNLRCYPNPANSFVTLNWKSDFVLPTTIKIYDIKGNLIFNQNTKSQKGNNSQRWFLKSGNFRSASSGVYLINIETLNAKATKKIVYLK